MGLLDRNDETSAEVWELIRMLATNENIYQEVLRLENAVDAQGNIQWKSFFENPNIYRRIYNLEIIEAVMEESESAQAASTGRVSLIELQPAGAKLVTRHKHNSLRDLEK